MKSRHVFFILFVFMGFVAGVIFKGKVFQKDEHLPTGIHHTNVDQSVQKLNNFLKYLQSDYVDQVDIDSLVNGVIENVVGTLDPHSIYVPDSLNQQFQEEIDGNYQGIGIGFLMIRDTVTVTSVFEQGPSQKAGILSGDKILIAGSDTLYGKNLDLNQIPKILKGPAQSLVKVQIYRKHLDSLLDLELVRDNISIPSVTSSYMVDLKTGYIKLETFSTTSFEEVEHALSRLVDQNMETLILDLRNNPGGLLTEAIQIADLFLSSGTLIVKVVRNNGESSDFKAGWKSDYFKGNVYVLVNEQSASASEVVASAIQDNSRGIIVGKRTYGKGLVQESIEIGQGDYLRLTTSRFYSPSGRSLQRPYRVNLEEYYKEPLKESSLGYQSEVYELPDGNDFSTKVLDQEQYSVEGGVVPDIYMYEPTDAIQETIENLKFLFYESNLVQGFVLEQIGKYHAQITLGNKAQFYNEPLPNEESCFEKFLSHALQRSINAQLLINNKSLGTNAIKAHIGRMIFGEDVYIRIKNQDDLYINSVMEITN